MLNILLIKVLDLFGYVNVYSAIIPSELAATSVVVSYWTDINPAVFITILSSDYCC